MNDDDDDKNRQLYDLGIITKEERDTFEHERKLKSATSINDKTLKGQYEFLMINCPLVVDDILEFCKVGKCLFDPDNARKNSFDQGMQNVGIYFEQKINQPTK